MSSKNFGLGHNSGDAYVDPGPDVGYVDRGPIAQCPQFDRVAVTEAAALDFIKAEQRKFERSGHNREFDYWWGANAASPGCASEFVTRWTIEKAN